MWYYNNKEVDLDDFFRDLLEDNDWWMNERVEAMLDECYEPWKFGNITFYPSKIVKQIDEVLWDSLVAEEIDCVVSEWMYCVNHWTAKEGENLYDFLKEFEFEDEMSKIIWREENE